MDHLNMSSFYECYLSIQMVKSLSFLEIRFWLDCQKMTTQENNNEIVVSYFRVKEYLDL